MFTLGLLERRRRETLAALAAAGLLERNRALPFPELPLTIALITSHGSAAYHDFLGTLGASGYGFRVRFVHATVQGREAERELVAALAAAGAPAPTASCSSAAAARAATWRSSTAGRSPRRSPPRPCRWSPASGTRSTAPSPIWWRTPRWRPRPRRPSC